MHYDEMTLKDLAALAKERGIKGYSRMKKADLIAALKAADAGAEKKGPPVRSGRFSDHPRAHRSNARSRRWWRRHRGARVSRRGGAA